jgi:hypothetical protein
MTSPGLFGTEDADLRGASTGLLLCLWPRPADVTIDGGASAEWVLRER